MASSSEPPTGAPIPRSALRRAAPRLLASLLVTAGFVWVLHRGGLPFAPPAEARDELRWWGLPAFVGAMLLVAYLRTWRWIYLLRPLAPDLQPWRVFGVGLVGFAAVFFAPLRLGEVVRPYLISQEGSVKFVDGVGTVAAERIIDGLVLVLLTALAFAVSTPISPLPDRVGDLPIPVALVPRTVLVATLIFSLAFGALVAFYFARQRARRLTHALIGLISPRLAETCSAMVERLAESFAFIPSWQRAAPFLRNTLLYWLVNGLALFALLRGVGLNASLPEAFATLGVIGLGSLLPAGPGFFGAYQVAAYTALAMYNSEQEVLTKGAMFVFVSYASHLALNTMTGAVGLLLLARVPARVGQS
jgi:glycosyltransferase 2 family protein